jgi:hypothetical protein
MSQCPLCGKLIDTCDCCGGDRQYIVCDECQANQEEQRKEVEQCQTN